MDEELLAAFVRDRSEATFRALYDRHAAGMYALAFRLMAGREADAADALQEAWTRALPRIHAFRGESSLRTWLCGFVVNCCRERLRTSREIRANDDWLNAVPEPGSAAVSRNATIDLERALAGLADGYRAVVILHDIHGYTHREIAEALAIDEGTSKSQLSRGREVLRRQLAEPLEERRLRRGEV